MIKERLDLVEVTEIKEIMLNYQKKIDKKWMNITIFAPLCTAVVGLAMTLLSSKEYLLRNSKFFVGVTLLVLLGSMMCHVFALHGKYSVKEFTCDRKCRKNNDEGKDAVHTDDGWFKCENDKIARETKCGNVTNVGIFRNKTMIALLDDSYKTV